MSYLSSFFFFNDTATTEIYTLSLHDALPISHQQAAFAGRRQAGRGGRGRAERGPEGPGPDRRDRRPRQALPRSEEHTSELQSRQYLVCRLLLEKKKKKYRNKLGQTKQYNQYM